MIEQYKETAIDTTQVYRMDKSVRQGGGLVGQLSIEFNNGSYVVFEAVTEEDLQELEFIYYRFVHKYDVTENKGMPWEEVHRLVNGEKAKVKQEEVK